MNCTKQTFSALESIMLKFQLQVNRKQEGIATKDAEAWVLRREGQSVSKAGVLVEEEAIKEVLAAESEVWVKEGQIQADLPVGLKTLDSQGRTRFKAEATHRTQEFSSADYHCKSMSTRLEGNSENLEEYSMFLWKMATHSSSLRTLIAL